jgi:hypothetical protein
MSVKPKLVCPPDYSILSLRFTECKKLGVVKGINTLVQYDLSNFFIPLTNYSDRRFTVKGGTKKKLDIGDLAVYGEIQESYSFKSSSIDSIENGTSHSFQIFDETGTTSLALITFTVDFDDPAYQDFATGFQTAFSQNTVMDNIINVTYSVTDSTGFTVTAAKPGVQYRYTMIYDTVSWSTPVPYTTPGTLVTPHLKYPEGRVRGFFLFADYAKVDTKTCTCGCTDASGDLLSNVKNFKWAWDGDYQKKQPANTLTGVLINADSSSASQRNLNGTQTFQWLSTGAYAPYQIKVGDLITLNSSSNSPYAYITEIDGYNITVDRQGFGNGTNTDAIVKKYFPSEIEWKVAGEMLYIPGGQDVYDTDRLLTETIWIHNPQGFDIPFNVIVIS